MTTASAAAATYCFTSEPLPPTLVADLKSFNSLSTEQIPAIFDCCLLTLKGQSAEAEQALQSFADTHAVNIRPLYHATTALLYVLHTGLTQSVSAESLYDDLVSLGLSSESTRCLSQLWRQHYHHCHLLAQSRTLTNNQLVDFQWKFGVTASSSDSNRLGQTFLQLRLTLRGNDGAVRRVLMELTLQQFYQFLQAMQTAKDMMAAITQTGAAVISQ